MSDLLEQLEIQLQNAIKELELFDAETESREAKRKVLTLAAESIQIRVNDYKQAEIVFNAKMAKMQEAYNTLYVQAQTGEGERATFSEVCQFGKEAGLTQPVEDIGEAIEETTG